MAKMNVPKKIKNTIFASPLKRIGAFLVDLLLLDILVVLPFRRYFESVMPAGTDFSEAYEYLQANTAIINDILYAFITISLIMILYFAFMEYKYAQTVGKMLLHIHVESDANSLAFWQCILRSLFLVPVFPFILLWVIDPVMLFIKGQRLSEILSKTRTVEEIL